MIHFFMSGGPMMWLLLLIALVVLVLFIKKAVQLFSGSTSPEDADAGINAVIFWGSISAVLGFFAHFYGVYQAMQAIKMANDISPAIVAEGYAMSLVTILFGMFILLVSAIFWFILRWKYKQLKLRSA